MDIKKDLERFENKLDKVAEDLSSIKLVQVEQAADLKHHIARTKASEQRIELIEEKLLPLVEIKHRFEGAFRFLGMAATVLGVIFGAVKAAETLINWL